jgi:hypothetical protein
VGNADWTATAIMVTNCGYQWALDELEGLVVVRMFELSKVHMANTGGSSMLVFSLLFGTVC